MRDSTKFKPVATKVSPGAKLALGQLCKNLGMSEYQLLQMMCDCLLRYMSSWHNLTPELERAMTVFEHLDGWRNAYNLADPSTDREVSEAIYLTRDSRGRKGGVRATLVRRGTDGMVATDNVLEMFERTTEVLLPGLHRAMTHAADESGCKSVAELLSKMTVQYLRDEDTLEFRRTFENVRMPDGAQLEYGNRTKKVRHYAPDDVERIPGYS